MVEKLQFSHKRSYSEFGDCNYGGKTYCVEVPIAEDLLKAVSGFIVNPDAPIAIKVGEAICHPKDRFVRKEGNRIANERLVPLSFKLNKISIENTLFYVTLFSEDVEIRLKGSFSLPKSNCILIWLNKDDY